jgi:hypothetical protein
MNHRHHVGFLRVALASYVTSSRGTLRSCTIELRVAYSWLKLVTSRRIVFEFTSRAADLTCPSVNAMPWAPSCWQLNSNLEIGGIRQQDHAPRRICVGVRLLSPPGRKRSVVPRSSGCRHQRVRVTTGSSPAVLRNVRHVPHSAPNFGQRCFSVQLGRQRSWVSIEV